MDNEHIDHLLQDASKAVATAPPLGDQQYLKYARELATQLESDWANIEAANARDLERAINAGLPETVIDRLRLGEPQLRHLLALCREVADCLPAACSPLDARDHRGMRLTSIPKPLGVLFMVYEARPTVTIEGALIGACTGNAVLLRGGSEMAETDAVLATSVRAALRSADLPLGMVTVIRDPDRRTFRALLQRSDAIDVLIPRGSPSLIGYCQKSSTIPVIASGGGANHLYVDASADLDLAAEVILDSKTAEPTACNTLELVLVERSIAGALLAATIRQADRTHNPIGLRTNITIEGAASPAVQIKPLDERDFGREFLEPAVGIHPVEDLHEAVSHIRRHGSQHTEGVVATSEHVIDQFVQGVDAAAIVVNGSLRLHDGPTLGLGPELSISTGRLHVRGPVGLTDLMTRSWRVDAAGATRSNLPVATLEGAEDLAS